MKGTVIAVPDTKEQSKSITSQEAKILDRIRELEYGAVEVIIKKGNPVFVNTRKEEKLD
jgi:hypothetical protein